MKISIVIPLYNKEPYVERAIRSIQAQGAAAHEVVVVDDGSTDGGPALVERLAADDARIRLVRQKNAGVSVARNAGIEHSSGDWVAFLDADDWWHPDYLGYVQALIGRHPSVDAVAAQYISIADGTDERDVKWPSSPADDGVELVTDLPARWLKGSSFFTGSIVVRRARLEAMRPCFPVGESAGEDLDLWFRIAEVSPIALGRRVLSARLWTPGGLSVLHRPIVETPFLLRLEERARSGRLPAALAASYEHFVDQTRITLARDAASSRRRSLALRLLWRAKASAANRRWCATFVMATLVPAGLVRNWQQWRKRRKMFV